MVGINLKKILVFLLISGLLPGLFACRGPESGNSAQSALLTSGDMVITRAAFEDHLELKLAAYPTDIRKTPVEFNSVVMALVKDLTEELILVRAAREKGITISEAELGKEEKKLKSDYPEDTFENMLLRNAVDYSYWKKRFKRQLLIDKLIRQELMEKIEITSQEMVSYYNRLKTDSTEEPKEKERIRMEEEDLVTQIRRRKAQKRYHEWVRELSEKFSVKVNNEKLKLILQSVHQG